MSENTQDMQIFSIVEQLEVLMESSPKPKLGGGNKRVVDIDEVYDLLGDLKVTIPDDIRRANSVLVDSRNITDNANEFAKDVVEKAQNEADRIVEEAEERASQIMQRAKEEYERLISEDEIYKEAQRRAQLLAAKAEYNANCVYDNAKVYADAVLVDLQRFLREYEQQVDMNRRDLGARAQQPVAQPQPAAQPEAEQQLDEPEESTPPRPERVRSARVRHKEPEPVEEELDDFEDEEDDFDEGEQKGFLGLFKRKKRVDDEDFFEEDM